MTVVDGDSALESLTDAEFVRLIAEHYGGEQATGYAYTRLIGIARIVELLDPTTPPNVRPRNHLRIIPGGQKGYP